MSTDFLEKIEKLPADKKKEVEDFVDFLIAKSNFKFQLGDNTDLKAGFGGGKGIFGKMDDDFDAPLDVMKDYM